MPLAQEDYAAIGEYVRNHFSAWLTEQSPREQASIQGKCASDTYDLVLQPDGIHGRSDHFRLKIDLIRMSKHTRVSKT